MTYGRNTSGYKPVKQPVETINSRHEAACFRYLQYVFHGELDWRIREAARQVFKYSPNFVLKSETTH